MSKKHVDIFDWNISLFKVALIEDFISFLDKLTQPLCLSRLDSFTKRYLVAPVDRRLDNAIHRINHYPVVSVNKTNHAIRWMVVYPVDSVIHLSNN